MIFESITWIRTNEKKILEKRLFVSYKAEAYEHRKII